MQFPEEQIDELKTLSAGIAACSDGGTNYILIPELKLPDNCSPREVRALLRTSASGDGYNSRLFFATKIACSPAPQSPLNWNAERVRICEQNWYAFSYKVDPCLRLKQMVAAHLRALK